MKNTARPCVGRGAAVVELFHPRAHAHLRALRALEYID